jgi:conjugative relaxase-like TrwC/TraI family protein
MLLIHPVTSATDAKNYYAGSFAAAPTSARQQYYSEGQENAGVFRGKLAERLGLAGKTIDKASFDRLCDNLHPSEDRPLTPRTNDQRRVCYDFTFSGPKSWSLAEAFADDELRRGMRQAFDEAVAETVAQDIEPDMQARERAKGADHDVTTGNVLTAGFNHATARPEDGSPPDPHWHQHLLIWNATQTADGRMRAAQFGNIVRDKGYYEAAFYSRLAAKTKAMGFEIDRRGGKEWEIAGVPQSMIDGFSKRTSRIESEAEKRGVTDAAEKAGLGAKTRSKKQKELTMDQLRRGWDAQLDDAERHALEAVYARRIDARPGVTASEAVAFAIAHCSEQNAVSPERELMRVALLHGLGDASVADVAAELPRHGVVVREFDGRRMATTEALQREEEFIVGFAANGRGAILPIGVPEGLQRGKLDDGQWAATVGLLQSSNAVNVVDGAAGTGKSWLLQKFDEAMRLAGERVGYLGTTTTAADELRDKAGFDAATVARFLVDEKMQAAAQGGRVVVDEISMLGHKDAHRLFELARKYDLKLICVGDERQHGSVPRGALMRILKDYAGVRSFRLEEIKRQQDPDYLAAVKLLAAGKPVEGFDALDAKRWVREIEDDAERSRAIAAAYLQAVDDKKTVLVVSPTHAEGDRITHEIRSVLREAGKLGAEDKAFTRLVAANASEAERGLVTTYRTGDVLVFHQNAKGFKKGEWFTVADPAAVPIGEAAKFQLYRPEQIALAEGDRIRFTATVKTIDGKHKLSNGASHTVAGFTRNGVRLENGWVVAADAGHFRSGFVETSFGSQGRTVDRVILGMSATSLPATSTEQMYVSSSRAKTLLTLFTDDKAAVRKAIEHSSRKLAALDLRPSRPKARATPWERVRKHLERLRRLTVIDRVRAAWNTPPRQPERRMGYER